MPTSLTERYIVSLSDPNLSEPIVYVAHTLAEVTSVLRRRGLWQTAPDGGGMILLTEHAGAHVYLDRPPWHVEDDLAARIEGAYPTHSVQIGPRGGIVVTRL